MRKLLYSLLVSAFLLYPGIASATDFKVNINVMRQEDGSTCGELWYNDQVVWRLEILADGAKAVSGPRSAATTLVVPDIVNGFFLLKVHN